MSDELTRRVLFLCPSKRQHSQDGLPYSNVR
jgi:hypothetical protein